MASSDDEEAETLPKSVSNYDFVDDKDDAVSFSVLPMVWSEAETPPPQNQQVFLRGTADNGLQKIYKPVSAWRFDISNAIPEVWVLNKENWIKLQKPRKIFEDIIRSILITVHCLHLVKRNPEISARSLWDNLSRVFSLYEVRPSLNDLVDHTCLISEAVKRDETLGQSQFLLTFLEEKPRKRQLVDEEIRPTAKSGFIVDDMYDDDMDDVVEDGSDEDEDLFDSVCAICDNGGQILCCEGKCLRSFHATVEDGEESVCATLGYSKEQVEAIENFVCKNCELKRQQCFICGKLGSSDKSQVAEVFLCANATCGHYYHPHCVSKFVHKENDVEADELRKKIAAGESFTCPIHKCCVCKQGENKKDPQLQFAVCRRCPKSYHHKCLPRKIALEDIEEEGIIQRAWEGLLPNRILIYCLKHEIDEEIGTPVRDHIVFPGDEEKKTKVEEKRKKPSLELLARREKLLSKKSTLGSRDTLQERTGLKTVKPAEKSSSTLREGETVKKSKKVPSGLNSSRKVKLIDTPGKSLQGSVRSVSTNLNKSITTGSKISLGDQLYELIKKGSDFEPVKPRKMDTIGITSGITSGDKTSIKPVLKRSSSMQLALDADSERRILALMKESASSITMKDVLEKHKIPSTHAYSSKSIVDKTITIGKVEGAVEAVRTALKKLEDGCSIEDARAVCEPEIVNQIFRWKNKLKVYLAPFLYGMRYTSFGRHFTKVEKLQEIVDKLHWYVQNGDTIVDFCCGANDFSCLMRKKLEEMGKKCSYRNYDCIQPKNDFNFEKRDWMTVKPKELPQGSQLIMGLNPPFGVKAALANKFIDKALAFKPKLLILIVPPETERLDKKKPPYDLVWEDDQSLSGKSFYLPGSVDVNDKQMEQWNVTPPPLYLWSRRDWTDKHKDIASKHGHLPRQLENDPMEGHDRHCDTSVQTDNLPIVNEKSEVNGSGIDHKENFSRCTGGRERLENLGIGNNHSGEGSRKRKFGDEKNKKSTDEKSEHGNVAARKEKSPRSKGDIERLENHGRGMNQTDGTRKKRPGREKRRRGTNERLQDDKKNGGRHHQSPINLINDRSSVDVRAETIEDVSMEIEPDMPDSQAQYGTPYGRMQASIHDETGRRYRISGDEPCASGDQRWLSGVSPLPEYGGGRSLDGQLLGHMRDNVDSFGYRPYISGLDRNYRNPSDVRSQIQLYGGQQDLDPFRGHNPSYGQMGPSTPYGHLSLEPDISYRMNNTSAMQRYAPRLDELNHTRMNPLMSEPPMVNRNVMYDPRAQAANDYQAGSMGYARGFQNSFSHQNSSGWLDE